MVRAKAEAAAVAAEDEVKTHEKHEYIKSANIQNRRSRQV